MSEKSWDGKKSSMISGNSNSRLDSSKMSFGSASMKRSQVLNENGK